MKIYKQIFLNMNIYNKIYKQIFTIPTEIYKQILVIDFCLKSMVVWLYCSSDNMFYIPMDNMIDSSELKHLQKLSSINLTKQEEDSLWISSIISFLDQIKNIDLSDKNIDNLSQNNLRTINWTKKFENIDELMNAKEDNLLEIEGVGEKTAREIVKFFSENKNRKIVEELKKYGILFLNEKKEKKIIGDKLNGKNFLVTGTLLKYKREEIKEIIELNGGKYLSGVSKKLNFLVAGDEPGGKVDKARELGIKIINEEEFELMIK